MTNRCNDTDTERRGALSVMAGGLILSATLAVAGCGGAEKHEAEMGEEGVTANEDLMREHGVLRRILIVYREAAPRIETDTATVDAHAINEAAALFRRFGEEYHERELEEAHIFPAVRNAGGEAAALVDVLLAQHARGREITDYVLSATRGGGIVSGQAMTLARVLTSFSRMYEAHAAREDTILFPAFRSALPAGRYAELGEQFEEIEHREFGEDGFDHAVAQVTDIEQRLGLSDLASFTAQSIVP